MQRYQDFESTTAGDVITILHAPSFEVSSVDRPLGHSPFYWSYDAAVEGVSRSEPGFSTAALVGRFDLEPSLSLPLKIDGWSFRPEFSLRDTSYTQQLSSTGSAESDPINRRALEGSVEVRPPALSRVFAGEFMGRKWKHVIEPRVVYSYTTGINNFGNILRFDERDILTNTNEVEYGVVNRLYAKRTSAQPEDCGKAGNAFSVYRRSTGAHAHSSLPIRSNCMTMNSMFVPGAWWPVSSTTWACSPRARQCSSDVPQSGMSIV